MIAWYLIYAKENNTGIVSDYLDTHIAHNDLLEDVYVLFAPWVKSILFIMEILIPSFCFQIFLYLPLAVITFEMMEGRIS